MFLESEGRRREALGTSEETGDRAHDDDEQASGSGKLRELDDYGGIFSTTKGGSALVVATRIKVKSDATLGERYTLLPFFLLLLFFFFFFLAFLGLVCE